MQQAGPERIISVNFSFLTKPALLKYNLCIIHVTHYKDTIDFSFSEFIHLCTNSAIRFLNTSMDLKSCLCLFTPYSHLWPQQLPVYIVSIILHLTEISSKRNHPLWGLCIWLLHLVKASEIHTGCSVGHKFALFFFFFCWVVFYRADSLSLLICSQLSETECFHTGMVGAFPGVETPSLDNSFLLRVVSWVSLHILLTVRAGREYERMVFLVWVQYSAGVLRFQLKISNFQWKIIVCVFFI